VLKKRLRLLLLSAVVGLRLVRLLRLEQAVKDKEQADKDRQMREAAERAKRQPMFKRGGSVSSASKRADGCATKGKTRGKFV